MNIQDKLPPDHVMREMARIANEAAFATCANFAEQFAKDPLLLKMTGTQALKAFAAAIRSNSAKVWQPVGAQQ